MKLSVEIHVLYTRYGDEKAIEMLKKAGYDSVDYSFYYLDETDEVLNESQYLEHARKVKRLLEENGMTCNQAHAPFDLTYGSKFDMSEKEYAKIVRSMEAAAIMGAENIVVHAITVPAEVDLFAYNLEFYKSLEPYCEKFGIHIAIENLFCRNKKNPWLHGKFHRPEHLNQMIAALDSPWFVVCVDVGHAGLTGIEPQSLIRGLDNKTLKALHIHDNDYLDDSHNVPYAGKLNWDEIMKALKDIDYKGDFTLEVVAYLKKMDDAFIEEALAYCAKTGRHLMGKMEA